MSRWVPVPWIWLLLACAAPAAADTMLALGHTDREVADYFAPVLYQDVADGVENQALFRYQDLLTNFDFDGNWDANDNAEHTYLFSLKGFVYYDVVETGNYLFVEYSFFHPRDWNSILYSFIDHENDQENIRLLVHKDGSEWGALKLVDMNAHGFLFAYWNLGEGVSGGTWTRSGPLDFEDDAGNVGDSFSATYHHVRVFIESKGHGPFNCALHDCDRNTDNDLVVYTVLPGATPDQAYEPDLDNIEEERVVLAQYVLLSGYEAYWTRRQAYTPDVIWDKEFVYDPARHGDPDAEPFDFTTEVDALKMGGDFQGDEGDGGGVPPWAFNGTLTGANPGDWLIDAAYVSAKWYVLPGQEEPEFEEYWFNPYLNDLLAEPRVDGDGDGVPDVYDNCPDVPNSDQADADGNGVGDACEPAPDDDTTDDDTVDDDASDDDADDDAADDDLTDDDATDDDSDDDIDDDVDDDVASDDDTAAGDVDNDDSGCGC